MDSAKEFNQYADYQEAEEISADLLKTSFNNLVGVDKELENEKDDIALRLRPTLPKKPPEIPRFSPSDAWKLLTVLETSQVEMSTVSDEPPVMIDEEKEEERLPYSPSHLLAQIYHRNSHDKSGDSGISGDGGCVDKVSPIRTTWTPQQDLDEDESSNSDILYNNSSLPHQLKNSNQFTLRPHVFSLSLPREKNRFLHFRNGSIADGNPTAAEPKTKQDILFSHSLQKLKRSVSGVLGFTPISDFEGKQSSPAAAAAAAAADPNTLDDNWFLSSSAPTSLQNYFTDKNDKFNATHCQTRLIGIEHDNVKNEGKVNDNCENMIKTVEENGTSQLASIPSFSSYFNSKGHVMYLPDTGSLLNDFNLNESPLQKKQNQIIKYKKHDQRATKNKSTTTLNYPEMRKLSYIKMTAAAAAADNSMTMSLALNSGRQFSKSCENISYDTRHDYLNESSLHDSQFQHVENVVAKRKEITKSNKNNYMNDVIRDINNKFFHLNRPKKFTFQSTVRQIERRRLAEQLSKEAEAKEKQRKNELEAMIKVEEEFQRKRNKEKANIRQQLRHYNMDKSTR